MTMQTTDLILALKNSFDTCEILEGSIARCERRFNGRLRSVYFIRASQALPNQREVDEIQRGVVAPSYFSSHDESRWNHYLVFIVPPSNAPYDIDRRTQIESDTSYARKFVVEHSELRSFLQRGVATRVSAAYNANALQFAWSDALQKAGLDSIDSDEPRTSVIRAIRGGSRGGERRLRPSVVDSQPLAFITKLKIKHFGTRRIKGDFTFGRINLIRGVNGAGKTSLLEAIEHFLCGGTARAKTAEALSATAIFTSSDREIPFQPRPASYYSQRDLRWYGRRTAQRNRLYEGFARYNFLSADAAVDFSREEDQHDLTTVLSRVALGPEAGFRWDRIQQIYGDIGPQLGALQREIASLEGHLGKVCERLEALRLPAPELSTRSTHAAGLLAKLGLQTEPDALSSPNGFRYVGGLRVLLDSAPVDLPETLNRAQAELLQTQATLEQLHGIESDLRANAVRLAELDNSLKSIDSLKRCVDRLRDYVTVEFAGLSARITQLNLNEPLRLPARDAMMRLRVAIDNAKLTEEKTTSLVQIADIIKAVVEDLRQQLDKASSAFSARSLQVEERKRLLAQLRSIGLQLISEDASNCCPLCHTTMSASSLVERMQQVMVDEDSAQLVTMEESRNRLLENLSSLVAAKGLVDSIVGRFPEIGHVSVEGVLAMIDDAETNGAERNADRIELVKAISQLKMEGFSAKEMLGLMARCEAELGVHFDSVPLSQDVLQRIDADISIRRSRTLKNVADCESTAVELQTTLNEKSVSTTGHADISDAKSAIANRAASLRKLITAFADLPAAVQESASITGLPRFMELAQMTYLQLTSLSDDLRDSQSRNSELIALNEESESLRAAIARLSAERANLKAAHDALSNIINEHSLEKGLNDFLSSNLESIQSIFQRIHVPNELRISNLSACELVRTADGSPTSLSQISTGQRAALVLSVFLTLNMSLRSGPPIMLVDDPIAHVDDMNSLAFLDYLADIAETGYRQVFFATADEKLANLFEKKMAFMGEEFQVISLDRGITIEDRNQ